MLNAQLEVREKEKKKRKELSKVLYVASNYAQDGTHKDVHNPCCANTYQLLMKHGSLVFHHRHARSDKQAADRVGEFLEDRSLCDRPHLFET